MPVTETRTLPAPFIESIGKTYADILPGVAGQPTTTTDISATMAQRAGESAADFQARQAAQSLAATKFGERQAGMAALAPQVAALDPLQTQAIGKSAGLGAYAPHLATATTALGQVSPYIGAAGAGLAGAGTTLGAAGTELTGAGTTLGGVSPYISAAGTGLGTAGTTLGGVSQYITGAGTAAGPSAYSAYMSPYQQQVIDATRDEYDIQAAKQKLALGAPSVAGAFGGGRHGLAEAEYTAASDRNRAALLGGLRQQGYTQAQELAGRGFTQQAGLAGMQGSLAQQQAAQAAQQLGLGAAQSSLAQQQAGFAGQRAGLGAQQAAMAQQQLGLGGAQTGLAQSYQQLAGLAPQLAAQEISGLGSLGAVRQAQSQAVLDAQRQAAQTAAYEPMERAGWFGGQVTGLMGGYPSQYQFTQTPEPSPLSSALQAGTGLASIFGNLALGKAMWGQ